MTCIQLNRIFDATGVFFGRLELHSISRHISSSFDYFFSSLLSTDFFVLLWFLSYRKAYFYVYQHRAVYCVECVK